MTNPYTLLDSVVTALRGIPALVALCDADSANIYGFKSAWSDATSWMQALRQQKARASVMVLWRGTGIGSWGRIPSRQHNFSLMIRDGAGSDIAAIWTALINGGFLSAAEIHADVEMVQDPTMELRSMQVTDTAWLDYWEAQFSLTEKSAA